MPGEIVFKSSCLWGNPSAVSSLIQKCLEIVETSRTASPVSRIGYQYSEGDRCSWRRDKDQLGLSLGICGNFGSMAIAVLKDRAAGLFRRPISGSS